MYSTITLSSWCLFQLENFAKQIRVRIRPFVWVCGVRVKGNEKYFCRTVSKPPLPTWRWKMFSFLTFKLQFFTTIEVVRGGVEKVFQRKNFFDQVGFFCCQLWFDWESSMWKLLIMSLVANLAKRRLLVAACQSWITLSISPRRKTSA